MFISQTAAQAIVEEIGNEIHEHINMMDSSGIIIASTNPERIGQVHEGARKVITEKLSELYITEDMETETTKKGTNLPLIVHNQIVGVVGITGDREQVHRYGNIVRRMTEIMVTDSISKDTKKYDRRMKYRFMEEWISKPQNSFSPAFIERGLHLGIDVKKPYRAVVLYFSDYQTLSDTLEGQRLLDDMETSIRHEMERRNILYLREPPRQICLFPVCANEKILKVLEYLSRMIRQKYNQTLIAGLDSIKSDKHNIHTCCLEAERAASHAFLWEGMFVCYDNLSIELFLDEISDNTMEEYLRKLFADLPSEKWDSYISIIENYFMYEGSVSKIAEAMFIHKNTLQYKLRKLTELTGKDIRLPSDSAVFFMAMLFYQKLNRTSGEHGSVSVLQQS